MSGEQRVKFLASLTASPNVSAACRAAEVPRRTAYNYRDADPDFAAAWDDAIEGATDALVGEAYKRAFDGSDTLAIFLLKCHRPAVYRETIQQEHRGDITVEYVNNWRAPLQSPAEPIGGQSGNPAALPAPGAADREGTGPPV
jgi:hypothetical protein